MQGRQRGFVQITGPEGVQEFETFTCGHCNKVVRVPHRAKPEELGGMCKLCMSMTCGPCTATGKCEPFEKKLERIEDRDRFFRQVGM